MEQSLADFVPVLVQLVLAGSIAAVILAASRLFGHRSRAGAIKDSPYECGLVAEGKAKTRFSVKFYVVAMLFIVFDVELVFLVPWATIYRDFLAAGIPILGPILVFLAVLAVGLVYEVKRGALEWER